MATIRDIARHTNLGIATVSRVLNERPGVSPETRETVLHAVKELNYRPNSIARSLVKKRTHSIGLIVSDITNPYFSTLAKHVEDLASEAGYAVVMCNTDHRVDKEEFYAAVLEERRVDGLVFASSGFNSKHIIHLAGKIPVAALDREIDHQNVCVVAQDNVKGTFLATEHLIANGHRRIACFTGPLTIAASLDRLRGYQMALSAHSLEVDRDLIREGRWTEESGAELARDLLARDNGVTAVVASNDLCALGVVEACREMGFGVPERLSVVGYDDIYLASLLRPRLTTVAQPIGEMSRAAMRFILARLHGQEPGDRRVVYSPRLVPRDSVAGPAKGIAGT
ncbi:MAG: LacI family DNA-binding transcriptional regulator [Patescibacteria group bacterium]